MTLEKCIEEISVLSVPFYQEPSKKEILYVIEETRKELIIAKKALELACKNHCNVLDVPDCLDVDGEICECFEECRNKEWIMDFYKAIAMEELKDES